MGNEAREEEENEVARRRLVREAEERERRAKEEGPVAYLRGRPKVETRLASKELARAVQHNNRQANNSGNNGEWHWDTECEGSS